jgi:uncharacterized protein YecE (DUF72 family)
MKTRPLVFVGAVHWLHPEWGPAFYPADLPEDWLLSYYNTQFRAVYLPAAAWSRVDAATWSEWLDDTQDDFVFVLEPAGPDVDIPVSARVRLATPEWAARHLWWLDETPDLRALARRVTQHAEQGEPLFVFSRTADLAQLEQVNTLKQVMGY